MKNLIWGIQCRNASALLDPNNTDPTITDNKVTQINKGFASKLEISRFQSCYNYFYELLHFDFFKRNGDSKESEWHQMGCSLIKWLITGEWEISDKEIRKIISAGAEMFSEKAWLQKR